MQSPPQTPFSETLPDTIPGMLVNCFQHLNPEDTIKTIHSLIHLLQSTEAFLLQRSSNSKNSSYLDVAKSNNTPTPRNSQHSP